MPSPQLRFPVLLLVTLVLLSCQGVPMLEREMHRSQWVNAHPTAQQVFHDDNMEVWNEGQRCYYFIKGRLKHIYQCGNLDSLD